MLWWIRIGLIAVVVIIALLIITGQIDAAVDLTVLVGGAIWNVIMNIVEFITTLGDRIGELTE